MNGRPLLAQASAASAVDRSLLIGMRRRGVRGGIIAKHRAMISYKITPARFLLNACVLPILWVVGLVLTFDLIFAVWGGFFDGMRTALDLPGAVSFKTYEILGFPSVNVPYLTTEAGWPDSGTWWISTGVSALLLIASFVLSARFLPLAYFLRAVVVVEATALVYFAFSDGPFPYHLPDYMAGFLGMGIALMVIAPVLLGLTYYIFTIPMRKKLFLTAMVLGHLAILLPMQALLHLYLIHHASLMIMPVLFFVFGLLPDILVLMAFYSWGMSWPPEREADHYPPMGGAHP